MAKEQAKAKVGDIVRAVNAAKLRIIGQVVEVHDNHVLITPGCTIDCGVMTPAQTYGPFAYAHASVTVLDI